MQKSYCKYILTLVWLLILPVLLNAQNKKNEDTEVYLAFRYRGVVNTVVTAYYKNNEFYLPVNELFSLLHINTRTIGLIVEGKYLQEQIPYSINFSSNTIRFGKSVYRISADEYLIKDLDFFLSPSFFEKVFGLSFSIDFNNLALSLDTGFSMPVVAELMREQKREMSQRNKNGDKQYPLRYGRKYSLFDAGFVDYNLSANHNFSDQQTFWNFNSSVGTQFAGGDFQGTVFGNYSDGSTVLATNNMRWRYVINNNPVLSGITIGQTTTDGVINNAYKGIRLTNEPIQPRRYFDEYEVSGTTIPQSEIELYLNNLLVDFQMADDAGNYRFLTPLSYGSSQLDLKIYGPTGQVIQHSDRLLIPFTFLPKGVINYHINAGELETQLKGNTGNNYVFQGDASLGLTNWLTSKIGTEHYSGDVTNHTSLFSSLSARIDKHYIMTVELVSSAYYRTTLNAVYGNASGFNIDYTNYTSHSDIYNSAGDDQKYIVSFFYPTRLFALPINFRVYNYTRIKNNINTSTYRFDLNVRLDKLNYRVSYKERVTDTYNPFDFTSVSQVETALTYNFSRNRSVSPYLRGSFIRSQLSFSPKNYKFETGEILFSKNILRKGKFQITAGRDFKFNSNMLRVNFVLDLNRIRTNTTYSSSQNNAVLTQDVRGSIGFDSNYNQFILSSRNQVGRAGTAIKLYIDNNSNGRFDRDDEIIPENALRIDKTGASNTSEKGVTYFTQMQPYYTYNLELNKSLLENPMLVPEFDKFSIITDPNRFKKIEIPFYMSGVIEGMVEKENSKGQKQGIGGLKLILTNEDKEIPQEIRTFSDGSFYSYEVPPGRYVLKVDPGQLTILKSKAIPEKIEFRVKPLSDGDFIEDLRFLLVPENYEESKERPDTLSITEAIKADPKMIDFEKRLADKVDKALRLIINAQTAFYNRDFESAITYVNQSLELFETAQAYALKGSLNYLRGNKAEAQKNWEIAVRFNPDIYIPDIEMLDQLITTDSME